MRKEQDKGLQMLNDGVKMGQLPEYDKPNGVKVVGIIPDLHTPYHNKKALNFLVETFLQRGVTDIVCIGDFGDFAGHSKKYTKNYNMMGPLETRKASQKALNQFAIEFPYVKFTLGNHDVRLVSTNNDEFFDDIEEALRRIYDIPETWKFAKEFIINKVCYTHGVKSGQNAAMATMNIKRMSTVVGHTHTFGGVQFSNNGIDTIFALNVGCLVDLDAIVFDYGVNNMYKPVLGCGIVYNSSYAEFVPMI